MVETTEPEQKIRATQIAIQRDRAVIHVAMAPGAPHYMTSEMAERALALFPSLAIHTCINDKGPTFGDVIAETSIPHLLEHIVVDLQVRAEKKPPQEGAVYTGKTEWTYEAGGLARIEVSYADDLVVLGALKDALHAINANVIG